jgi:polysaccharide export outer membrane protein
MRRLVLLFVAISLFYSCRTINPSVMFKTGKDYPYAQPDSVSKRVQSEYKLSEYDELQLYIYTNNGYKLVDITGSASATTANSVKYTIEKDGFAKLPQVGRVSLKGYTVKEAEKLLEEKYSAYFNNPFVVINVSNRRVYLFTGEGGSAAIVTMNTDNMTLIEALAQAGGIREKGKAYKIKLIRGDLKNPKVYLIDLSTIEGMKEADLQLQSNDIIYIEPTRNLADTVLVQISPILGLFTTILLSIALFNK